MLLSGNLEAAESECAASLAVWSGFASGHLKMAQILRARGASEQVSRIRGVFELSNVIHTLILHGVDLYV